MRRERESTRPKSSLDQEPTTHLHGHFTPA